MADTMSPEDKLAVQELIADYALRLDSGDLDGYVDNFTEDGVFEGTSGRFEGRDAVRAYVGHLMETRGDGPTLRHVLGIPSIHGDATRCHAQTYVIIPGQKGDAPISIPLVGVYTDEIVKVDGRWRFAKRNVRMDLIGPERR